MYDTNDDQLLDKAFSELPEEDQTEKHQWKKEKTPYILSFLAALLISCLGVVNPFLTQLASNLQTQNLYAGWAMAQGQEVYSQIYGTSGLLYYLMDWVGSLAFGQVLLLVFQALALWLAGIFLHKALLRLDLKTGLASQLVWLFYLLVLGLGFGGLYATLYVLPFIFWSLWFLVRYLQDAVKDERFILYGAFAALAFMIDPAPSLLFYFLTSLVLLVYNIASKKIARGFYQLLAGLLGFSLAFYPLGYYTVANQTFGLAISQVTYAWDSFNLLGSHILSNLLFYGLLVVGLGFATAFGQALLSGDKEEAGASKALRFIGLLGLLISLIFVLGLPDQGSHQLLPLLPFAMILFALWFNKGKKQAGRHRRDRRRKGTWTSYLSGQFFLPVFALLYLLGAPAVNHYILESGQAAERSQAARYIRQESSDRDQVYAWDKTASLYQTSQRLSASSLLTPTLYQGTAENRLKLENDLKNNQPEFILVNNQVPLTSQVEETLKQNYRESKQNYRHFKLYKHK